MKHKKLCIPTLIFLYIYMPILCMQIKKQENFIFNQENYHESKKSENNKFFVGAIWDEQKQISSKIHIISLPKKKLHWRIPFGYPISYIFCSPSGRYVLLSSYHETNPKTQLWDIKIKKCILREKKHVTKVFWGKSEKYVGFLSTYKKYSDGICLYNQQHTLIFDTINKKYIARYEKDCRNYFLDYPKNFLFFSIYTKYTKILEVIVNMNTGKELGKLRSIEKQNAKQHLDNWFKNKSVKILYLKRPQVKYPYAFVLVGGKKMQKNLYAPHKYKKFEDICIFCKCLRK